MLAVKAPMRPDTPIADGKDTLEPWRIARLKTYERTVCTYQFASD
jgi:hypothetical protein